IVAAHANLGVVLVSLGRFDEAITQYNIALAEAPGSPELRLNLGLAYYKKSDFAGAAAQFASLHKEDPSDFRVATLLGNCQVQLANAFLIDRKLNEARQETDRALAIDPNSLAARYELARIERTEGNLPAALKDLEAIERQNPQWLPPHVELSALYYRLQRPKDGDREKEFVNQLRTEEQDRRGQNRVISPRVPLP